MKKSIIIGLIGALFLTAGEFDIPALGTGILFSTKIIGDFDNDGSADVYAQTYTSSNQTYSHGIYSFAKKQYLIELSDRQDYYDTENNIEWADLDGNAGVEILFDGRIYTYIGGTTTQSVK